MRGNVFEDLSGTAIHLGGIDPADHHPEDARVIVQDNSIDNNYIARVGQEFFGSVGIWNGYTQDTVISHNELTDLPYTAISSGWGWGCADPGGNPFLNCDAGYQTPTTLSNIQILDNSIHDVMKVNSDGGGIYTLSAHRESKIEGNYIRYVGETHPRIGLYFDSGSRYISVRGNAIHDAPLIYFDKGGDLVFEDNYWTVERTATGDADCRAVFQSGPFNDACRRFWDFGGDSTYGTNHDVETADEIPEEIIKNAGVQARYRSLIDREVPI